MGLINMQDQIKQREETTYQHTETSRGGVRDVGYVRLPLIETTFDHAFSGVTLDRIFIDKMSAKTAIQEQLGACLEYVREGDTVHVPSLYLLCLRGTEDLIALVHNLAAKKVSLMVHKEGYHFSGDMTMSQRGVLSILDSVARMDKELVEERKLLRRYKAKEEGRSLGRPRSKPRKADIMELVSQGLSVEEAAKQLGIGRSTAYRRIEG